MKKFTEIYQSTALLIGALGLMVICYYQRQTISELKNENNKVKIEAQSIQGGYIAKSQTMDSLQHLVDSFYY